MACCVNALRSFHSRMFRGKSCTYQGADLFSEVGGGGDEVLAQKSKIEARTARELHDVK